MNAKCSRLPVGVKPHHNGSPGGLVNTRQQWSKYICGMLNSGLGGVLFGGIFDDTLLPEMYKKMSLNSKSGFELESFCIIVQFYLKYIYKCRL